MDTLPTRRYAHGLSTSGRIFPRDQLTPEALASLRKAEMKKWWPIIKAANVKGRVTRRTAHETSPPKTISGSGRGRCCAADLVKRCEGARLPDAACAYRRRFPSWRRERHHCTPDGSMAFRTPRPAIRHREPTRGRQQYRHRGGRTLSPGRLYASTYRVTKTQHFTTGCPTISFATSHRSPASSALLMSWK